MRAALVACDANDLGCIDSGDSGGSTTATTSNCVITLFEVDGKPYLESPVGVSVGETGLVTATFTWNSNGCHHTKFTQTQMEFLQQTWIAIQEQQSLIFFIS